MRCQVRAALYWQRKDPSLAVQGPLWHQARPTSVWARMGSEAMNSQGMWGHRIMKPKGTLECI